MQTAAREYETIYIMEPNIDADEADRIASRLSEIVDRLEGKLTKVDNWGRRKLAYPIRKSTRGIYVYLRYLGSGQTVAELERNLRLIDPVVRYQTVLLRSNVDTAAVAVDPEDVKFKRIELGEEEAEPALEQRLGLVDEPRAARPTSEAELDEGFDDAEDETPSGDAVAASEEEA